MAAQENENKEQDTDVSLEFDSELAPLLPSGEEYVVAFLRADKRWMFGKVLKIVMQFEIVMPVQYLGTRLFMAANVPERNRWTMGYKFLQAWMLATGRRPNRRDRLSTKVFRGKYFRARVTVVGKTAKNASRATPTHYSIVEELIEVYAGGPGHAPKSV